MRWPNHIPAGLVQSEVAASIDIYPTLAKLAGVPLPTGELVNGKPIVIDGVDIWPLMQGAPAASRGIPFYYETSAIRMGDYILRNDSLYNIRLDIHEDSDLSASESAKKAELKKALTAFQATIVVRGPGKLTSPEPIGGCTNPAATNFNPLARRDDLTCQLSTTKLKLNYSQSFLTAGQITVLPGPRGEWQLRLDHPAQVELYNLSGTREWSSGAKASREYHFSSEGLTKGIHYLRIAGAKSSTQPLLLP